MRQMGRHLLIVGAILLAGALWACGGPWRDSYFDKGVDRLTQEDVSERMGPPHTAKIPTLGGDSVWTYRVPISDKDLASVTLSGLTDPVQEVTALMGKVAADSPKAMLYCYRYTLTFNEQKILKQWKREECAPGTHDTLNAN
jgi:hypothetical protein